jgi:hypothetical protein
MHLKKELLLQPLNPNSVHVHWERAVTDIRHLKFEGLPMFHTFPFMTNNSEHSKEVIWFFPKSVAV